MLAIRESTSYRNVDAVHGGSSPSCAPALGRRQSLLRLPRNTLCNQRRVRNDKPATENHRILNEPGCCLAEASH